jgi:outer membrane autotransporter protein
LFIGPASEIKFAANEFIINSPGGLYHSGKINLRGAAPGKSLFLNGNYIAERGSSILFNTKLGKDNSLTDRFVISGNSSGQSAFFVNNVGGTGAKTINGINLIEVQGNSDVVFTFGAPVQLGSW